MLCMSVYMVVWFRVSVGAAGMFFKRVLSLVCVEFDESHRSAKVVYEIAGGCCIGGMLSVVSDQRSVWVSQR